MASKNGTYVVGCKIPTGLVIRGAGKQWRIKGARESSIIGGFGLTEGVPAEVWEDFARHHKDSKAIRNGAIFAVGDMQSARDAAKDHEKQKTGMERLDRHKQAVKPMDEE